MSGAFGTAWSMRLRVGLCWRQVSSKSAPYRVVRRVASRCDVRAAGGKGQVSRSAIKVPVQFAMARMCSGY
jgi:hypothetical protein